MCLYLRVFYAYNMTLYSGGLIEICEFVKHIAVNTWQALLEFPLSLSDAFLYQHHYFTNFCFLLHFVNVLLLGCMGIQCLMYLYHYPDIWYDYATWHAKSGSIDAAIKVFQRALKALPGTQFFFFTSPQLKEEFLRIIPYLCFFFIVGLGDNRC